MTQSRHNPTWTLEAPAAVPSSLGRYHLDQLVGAGGTAFVFAATDRMSRAPFAVKVLRAQDQRDRFETEIGALRAIDHPNVPRLRESGIDGTWRYLVEELAAGTADRPGRVPVEVVAAWMVQVLAGLDAAHRLGMVHRDVKPANVLLGSDGRALLGDFGLALLPGRGSSEPTDGIVGSPGFRSPELHAGPQVGPPSDLYAAGATVYALATGDSAVGLSGCDPGDPRWTPLPAPLRPIVLRATRPLATDRYPDARGMARALAPLARPEDLDPHVGAWLA